MACSPNPFQTCRQQHLHWGATLAQREADINQLLALLAELPAADTYRSLRRSRIEHTRALHRLRHDIHRLRLDMLCTAPVCALPCPDPRNVSPLVGNTLIGHVTEDFNQLKARCQTFLNGLMGLNLI